MRPEEQVRRDELWRPVLAQVLDDYRAVTGDVSSARPRQGTDPAASPWAMSGYVDGPALPEIVGVLGPLPPSAVAALAIGIAGALAELHAVGVVRGDLNPVNVLLIEDGLGLRVAGFGMASAADGSTLAEAGWAFDDPGYLAPEQVLGLPVGPVADVFALGGVLVYAASGVLPFGTGEPSVMVYRIVHEEPALDGVPAVLRGLVKACLSKDPAQRPALQTVIDRAIGVLSDAEAAKVLDAASAAQARPEPEFPEPELEQTAFLEAVVPESVFQEPAFRGSAFPESVFPESVFQDSDFPEATQILAMPPLDTEPTSIFSPRKPSAPAPPPAPPSTPPRRGRSRSASLATLGTVVVVGVAAAFLVRAVAHSDTPKAARPSPSATTPSAPLPGTFLAGPGCAASRWASTTQAVAAAGNLEPNLAGGAPTCGGRAIAFVKNGTTAPGASGYSWTFHLGWSARCTLSVFVANADPSSGLALYELYIPASSTATGLTTTFQINQGKAKGQWVTVPALTKVALPDGAVQLRLTDAGSFTGDRFHVTASAVQAVCSQVP